MTRLLLNCETSDTALSSLGKILGVVPGTLLDRMRSAKIDVNDQADEVEEKLATQFLPETVGLEFSVCWFHGTRLHRSHTLLTEGLLPMHIVEPRLRSLLQTLGTGMERRGNNPFATSKTFKPAHEGPFGMLCRTAVVRPAGLNGNYIFHPELVDDIAGELLGENFRSLTDRFASESTTCVVHFLGPPTESTLNKALRYVYETQIEGRDDVEAAASSNACFDGGGEIISPSRILKIAFLKALEAHRDKTDDLNQGCDARSAHRPDSYYAKEI